MGKIRFINYPHPSVFIRVHLWTIFLLFFSSLIIPAQSKIAVVAPDKTNRSAHFAEKLADSFSTGTKVLDNSLSQAAFTAQNFDKPFNLSLNEAKNAGAAIGCDYFLLVKTENLRRASLSDADFYESYAAIFAVGTRTGELVFWKLNSFKAETADGADKKLNDSIKSLTAEVFAKLKNDSQSEPQKNAAPPFENLPQEGSPAAENFRPPLPYKRFRPEYTPLANLYGIEATVDAEIDVDETGKISRVRIARWAGFGLDESVADNILKMNWRAAERSGKSVPTRVLLRYNFKKIDPE